MTYVATLKCPSGCKHLRLLCHGDSIFHSQVQVVHKHHSRIRSMSKERSLVFMESMMLLIEANYERQDNLSHTDDDLCVRGYLRSVAKYTIRTNH